MSEEGTDALVQEALRQEVGSLSTALDERYKELQQAEDARHMLEDELEDAYKEVDRLRRELDKVVVEADEAEYLRKEAEDARKTVESALYNVQEGIEESKIADFRDQRLKRTKHALDIGGFARHSSFGGFLLGFLTAVVLMVIALAALFVFR